MVQATTSPTRKKGDSKHEKQLQENADWACAPDRVCDREPCASEDTARATGGTKFSERNSDHAQRQEGQVLRRSDERQDRDHQFYVREVRRQMPRHNGKPGTGTETAR